MGNLEELIFMLEEYYRLDKESWERELIKVDKIYDTYGNIKFLEIEDNILFIDNNGEIVEVLYE